MKYYIYLVWVLVLILGISCKSTKSTYTSQEVALFRDFLDNKSYEFVATVANPIPSTGMTAIANTGLLPPGSTVSNIQLQGNFNYLRVKGDTISASLPYYGERQQGGGYHSDAGIKFNDVPSNYSETYDSEKNEMRINFSISGKSEGYRVTLYLYPNKKATAVVNSNQRFSIRYLGEIKALEEKPEVSR